MLVLALAAQALRYWAVLTLGGSWNVRVIVVPGDLAVTAGPYRYLRHPKVEALRSATGDLMYRTPHLAWGNLGWAYYEQHDYPDALNALQQAVAIQPQFCNGWFRIGQVDFALGEAKTSPA